MNRKINGFVFLIFFLFINIAANAQMTINLELARLLGLTNSQELARVNASIRTALINERTQLYNSLLPKVSADYSAGVDFLQTQSGNTQFVNPLDTFKASVSLTASYSFTLGGNDFINRSINQIKTDIARINMMSTYYSVLNSVDKAYYDVLRAIADLESAESLLQSEMLSLSISEVRFRNGMINQIDYLNAQSRKESRENTRNQSRRTLSLRMIILKDLIGVQEDIILEPVSFDAYDEVLRRLALISVNDTDLLYENLWNVVVANNPSLKTAALDNRIAEINYSHSVRTEFLPTITLSVNFGDVLNYSSSGGFSYPHSFNGSVTLKGSIPIDIWVRSNNIENYKIARENASNTFNNALRSSQTGLLTDLYNLLAQASAVLSSRRSLEIAENAYAGTLERYMLSQTSEKDLGDASNSLRDSRNNLNNANYSFLQSFSALRNSCALDDEQQFINLLLGL